MVKCDVCGEEVVDGSKFCSKCGSEISLKAEEEKVEDVMEDEIPVAPKNTQTKFCTNCGSEIDIKAVVCPKCGVSTKTPTATKEKSAALGIILNFFVPGLGHIGCEFTHRGLNFLVMYVISIALMFVLIGFILVPVIWIWSMIDVNTCVNKANAGEFVDEKIIF
ncbi:MAG: zinc-ribbon domain-containing protein [Methanobrevibacter sp.]|nr:zinc-ribbon domain-containing protein [Methanobrevibacter sp.]